MEVRNPEKIVVVVYTAYVTVLLFAASILSWPVWINIVVLAGILTVWIVYLKEVRDYKFRALLYSAVALATFALYNTLETSFEGILTTYCAIVVALSILKVPEIVIPEYLFSTFLIVYHGVFQGNIPIATTHERILSGVQILAVFVVIAITHNLIKRRIEKDQSLQDMSSEMKAEEQRQLDFLAHVSRQVMAHLQNIGAINTQMLQEDIPENARREGLQVQTEGRRLLATINDLLDYSQLESGKVELEEKEYHPASAINDTISMAIADKGDKDLELIVDCDAKMPSVLYGDEEKLRRVVLCLVNNAVKYTKTGGITITFSARKEGYGINLCMKVKDTGVGIAAEKLEQILSGFRRFDVENQKADGGIGIGLAISKRLIENMNGFISARSEPGKGSEFRFVVPQKVIDERPMAVVHQAEEMNFLVYIDTEKSEMAAFRDDYMNSVRRMMESLELRYRVCRNLDEFKRRCEREIFTHVLMSSAEYMADEAYFNKLARHMDIIMIQNQQDSIIARDKVKVIYKPFSVLSLASVLNGEHFLQEAGNADVAEVTDALQGVSVRREPDDVRINRAADSRKASNQSHIDRKIGLQHMGGSLEHYEAILQAYLSEGREKIPVIREKYQMGDWENYVIYVHAVKSNSFGIGAEALGEMAKALEAAGKEENTEYIRSHHEEMMRLYEDVLAEIDEEGHRQADEGRDRS